jgi:catechol 2,3-dioxygenase-like lactoylglutathione lyase family enzyme
MSILRAHLILYVADQAASTRFYRSVLLVEPTLDVPGMTELTLPGGTVLGLMPETGAARLLGPPYDPSRAAGVPRAELYLVVDDPAAYHARSIAAGAKEISRLSARDWGHDAGYSLDPDGHVIAFARVSSP